MMGKMSVVMGLLWAGVLVVSGGCQELEQCREDNATLRAQIDKDQQEIRTREETVLHFSNLLEQMTKEKAQSEASHAARIRELESEMANKTVAHRSDRAKLEESIKSLLEAKGQVKKQADELAAVQAEMGKVREILAKQIDENAKLSAKVAELTSKLEAATEAPATEVESGK